MNSSEGPASPREEKEQNNNQTDLIKGCDICPVHKILMERAEIDVPIEDENGNNIFDSGGNLMTERIAVCFCWKCDAD